MKKMLIIFDGASDLPIKLFGGKTPLEYANTPNLDFFAKYGVQGYMYTLNENTIPTSDTALMSIFGNNPKECKRGVYEALGAGLELKKGELAFRTNFGTIDNLRNKIVIDRRAGRTLTTKEAKLLAKALNSKINIKKNFILKSTVQHRGVLVIKGNLSEEISDVDISRSNHKNKNHKNNMNTKKFHYSKPLSYNKISTITSEIVNSFVDQSFKILNNHPLYCLIFLLFIPAPLRKIIFAGRSPFFILARFIGWLFKILKD